MADSSVKYQKFVVSQVDNEPKPNKVYRSSKNQLICVLVLTALIASICALIVAVGVGVGVSLSSNGGSGSVQPSTDGGLTVITITPEELKGKYQGPDGGILFQSTMNETFFTLSITTTSGEQLVVIVHPLALEHDMTMMSVNTTNFMVMEEEPGRPKYDGYVVPSSSMSLLESVMMGEEKMSENIFQQLDNKTVNETLQLVLQSLTMSDEARLIIEAAEALGKLGIQTSDYPPIIRFYLLALTLAKARANEAGTTNDYGSNRKFFKESRQTRAIRCSNGATCSRDQCPYIHEGNDCFGMCGPQCTCWSFICGNCCVNRYCETHDQCCADRGFFSFPCLSVAWRVLGSRCSQSYSC